MTAGLLGFNLAVSVYAIAGSLNAEWHTLAADGEAYRSYQRQVPFFLPAPWAGPG